MRGSSGLRGGASQVAQVVAERSASKQFRSDIEGLRAVAVLSVVLFHAGIPFLHGGFVGVDVFFVISGFLITGLLWREVGSTGTVTLRRFWGARARRLLPASATVAVVTMIAAAFLLPLLQAKSVAIDGITSALYICNYWFIGSGVNYFGNGQPPSPFQHYWSLAVEEQFYLVWPVLIIGTAWLIRRFRRPSAAATGPVSVRPYLIVLTLVAVISFGLSLITTYLVPPLAYFSLPTRAWQLAAGGLVALTVIYWRRLPARAATAVGWVGLGLILLACVWLTESTLYPGVAALLPTMGAVLVIGAGCGASDRGCARLLGNSGMTAIGRLSYSWYLWHWPLLVLLPALLGGHDGPAIKFVAVLLSASLAALTLRYIENPWRFSPQMRNSARASLTLGGVATAIAVIVGLVLWLVIPDPVGRGPAATPMRITAQQVPPGSPPAAYDAAVRDVFAQVQEVVADSTGLTAVPSNLSPPLAGVTAQLRAISTNGCLRLPFQSGQGKCVAGDPSSATRVALIGDSRAAMFNAAFQKVAGERRWRLEMMAKTACPVVDLPIAHIGNSLVEWLQHCAQWRAEIKDRLRAERPDLIVVSMTRYYGSKGFGVFMPGFEFYDSAWISALGDFVQEFRGLGSKVLVLGPSPDAGASVPDCLSAYLDDPAACAASPGQPPLKPAGLAAEAAVVQSNGGSYADLIPLFCAPQSCPAIIGNTMVFFDGGHITREYSEQLAPAMGALADQALATN